MIKPTNDRVLLKPIKEEKTESGIILTSPEKTNRATIEAVGEDVSSVKKGDTVIYQGGIPITYEGEQYLILKESALLGLVEENE